MRAQLPWSITIWLGVPTQDLSQNRGKQLASSCGNFRGVVYGIWQILRDRESWTFEEFRRSQTKYTIFG